MLLVLMSHNLGVMWVGMEATTLLTAFLISLHPTEPVAGSDVEIPDHLLDRYRLRIHGDACLPRPRSSPAMRRPRRCSGPMLAAPDTRLDPTLDEVRLRLRAGRLWHQGRAGADPFLAAGRAQPGAGPGVGDVFRISAQHRALLHHALRAAGAACPRGRLRRRPADRLRRAVDPGGGRVYRVPARRQAPARLSQRRASWGSSPSATAWGRSAPSPRCSTR